MSGFGFNPENLIIFQLHADKIEGSKYKQFTNYQDTNKLQRDL